jgi:hypothetical protein
MQNAIKLENISNLITSPSSYQCRETTVNMKVGAQICPNLINRHSVNLAVFVHCGRLSSILFLLFYACIYGLIL